MSGLISSILAVAGFGPPPVAPAQRRRRAAPVRARTPQAAAGAAQAVRPKRPMSRMDENFGGPYVPPPAVPAKRTARVSAPVPPSNHRVRKVNGTGMLLLAMGCMGVGGWVGSHVQAFAEGGSHTSGVVVVDPMALTNTGSGPPFSF